MNRIVLASPFAAVLLAACGSSVVPDHDHDAATDGPPIGDPDASSCNAAAPAVVTITYSAPGDTTLDCSQPGSGAPGGGPGPIVDRNAAVIEAHDTAWGTHVSLDFCSPAADCGLTMHGSLDIAAAGFSLATGAAAVRSGQFLRIRSRATRLWGCTMQIEISNAATWDGAPNPVNSSNALIAAASSGEPTSLPGASTGITVSVIGTGCFGTGANCGSRPEQQALSVQPSCDACFRAPDPMTVPQGSHVGFLNNQLAYVAYDARSFVSGLCDDGAEYAWTLLQAPTR